MATPSTTDKIIASRVLFSSPTVHTLEAPSFPTSALIPGVLRVTNIRALRLLAFAMVDCEIDDVLTLMASFVAYVDPAHSHPGGASQTLAAFGEQSITLPSEVVIPFADLTDTFVGQATDAEIGAYFGVMFTALAKTATPQNIQAFQARRVPAVQSRVGDDLKIFSNEFALLDEEVLGKVNRAAARNPHTVARLIYHVVSNITEIGTSPTGASFLMMFKLLEGHGMTALTVVRDALSFAPWLAEKFPILEPQLVLIEEALQRLALTQPRAMIPYAKAALGERYVPAPMQAVSLIVGFSREVVLHFKESMSNYQGGYVPPQMLSKLQDELTESGLVEPAAAMTLA